MKMRKRNKNSFPDVAPKVEGATVIVTDFDTVMVSEETIAMCRGLHERRGLKERTVARRTEGSLIAIAHYLSKKAWESGNCLEEI